MLNSFRPLQEQFNALLIKENVTPVKCLVGSNSLIACGAKFDKRKNPKKAVRNMALKVLELLTPKQQSTSFVRVGISMIFFLDTTRGLLVLMDLMKYFICGWSKGSCGRLYIMDIAFNADI